jgi:Family of unknown function (DUF6448)
LQLSSLCVRWASRLKQWRIGISFETVVRTHRAGEGAPYTGLKPAGSPVGPVIPMAEEAVATGSVEHLAAYLTDVLRHELSTRLQTVGALAADKGLTGDIRLMALVVVLLVAGRAARRLHNLSYI